MKCRKTLLALPAVLLAASLVGACENTARGLQQDAANNAESAKAATQDAAQATENAAESAAQTAKAASEKAGQKAKNAAASAVATLDATAQAVEIKAALMADKSVDASRIDVDADGKAKIVTLKGTIPTASQKVAAGRIAQAKAPDYRIVNTLAVAP